MNHRNDWARNFRWVIYLLVSSILTACTVFLPPDLSPAPTTIIDQPPTRTAEPTGTPTPVQPSATAPGVQRTPTASQPAPPHTATQPAPAPTLVYEYILQPGSPSYLPNVFQPDLGCSWMGVGGQIFDRKGEPIQGLIVEITGELEDRQVLELSISGGAIQYGAGGYEIPLSNRPIGSEGIMQAVVYDLQGRALSAPVVFDTYESCTANLVLINFLANDFFQNRYYLPLTGNHTRPR